MWIVNYLYLREGGIAQFVDTSSYYGYMLF